jgi:hypothetical protein
MRPRAMLEAVSDDAPILLAAAMVGKGRSYGHSIGTTNRTMGLASEIRKAVDLERPERARPAPDDILEVCRGLIRWLFLSS